MRHYAHKHHVTSLETNVSKKYLCLSALAALIDSLEESDKFSFVKGTVRPRGSSGGGAVAAAVAACGTCADAGTPRAVPHPLARR